MKRLFIITVMLLIGPLAAQAWRSEGDLVVQSAIESKPLGPTLFVGCVGSTPALGVRFPGQTFVGAVAVVWRVDQQPEATSTWQASGEEGVLQIVGAIAVEDFLKQLDGASQLEISTRSVDKSVARFSLDGIRTAAGPVLGKCAASP
jgi:hypothetical protein